MNAATRIPVVLEFDTDDLPVGQETGNSPEEYTYDPLPDSHCFRVLELRPGDRDSRLECLLSIERLGDQDLPPYRAVSYTWTESKYDNLVIAGKKVTEFPGPREKYLIQAREIQVSLSIAPPLSYIQPSTPYIQLGWVSFSSDGAKSAPDQPM